MRDDALLLAAAAGGDAEAFAALYQRRRPDVFRFALHVTGDTAAAEDVVQETFMTVIRQAVRYDPARAAVVPWLLGIARNHARRRDRRTFDPLPDDRAGGLAGSGADPAVALIRDEDVARLRAAIHGLPYPYREAVVLCDVQELTYADAAAALGCAVGTVRSRLHRGRALLGEAMRAGERRMARWPDPTWIL